MAELMLPSGLVALVDDAVLAAVLAVGPWHVRRERRRLYVRRLLSSARRQQYLHKFLTGYPMTDHANGNGLDNRRSNLRPCNDAQNQANRVPVHSRSGFRGVTRRQSGRWQATIKRDGRMIYLGLYDTPEAAARAYDAAAVEAWGEYARPNFPADATISGPSPRHTRPEPDGAGVAPGAGARP